MFKPVIRLTIMMLLSLLLIVPTFAQTTDIFTVTSATLNARTGPGIQYDIVGRLQRGSTYNILDYSPTVNWVLLDLGYAQAWAFRHLGEIESFNVPTTVNVPTSPIVDPILGQGGGFAPPIVVQTTIPTITETGVDLTTTSTPEEFNSTFGVTTTLRMRISPTLNARIIGAIPYDQRATPIGRTANGTWIQAEYDGTVGWVYFLYIAFPPAIDVRTLPITG